MPERKEKNISLIPVNGKEHLGNGSAVGKGGEQQPWQGLCTLQGTQMRAGMSSEGLHSAKPLLCCETT